jgi:hypothetical protein
VVKDKPIAPEPVERYLEAKFDEHLDAVRKALSQLAGSLSKDELEKEAFLLYEKFRPEIPPETARISTLAGAGFDTDASSLGANVEVDFSPGSTPDSDGYDWAEVAAA